MPDLEPRRPDYSQLPWQYFTRVVGAVVFLYGVFGDKTPERSTLILTGAGLMGIEFVAPKRD